MYICTTVGGFQYKPDLAKIKWEVKDLTTNEIVDQLKCGHSLSQNFKTSRKTRLLEQRDRTKDNFKSTQFIFIDLDEYPDDGIRQFLPELGTPFIAGSFLVSDGLNSVDHTDLLHTMLSTFLVGISGRYNRCSWC